MRGYALYLLASGNVLYLGLVLMAGGAALAATHRRAGAGLVWSGMVLAVVSAIPIHPGSYALLALSTLAWQLGLKRGTAARLKVTIVLVAVVTVVMTAALAVRADSRLKLPGDSTVFVIGDSLSTGLGDDHHHVWPELLAAGRQVEVRNLARAGARLADGVSQGRAIPPGPAIVIVELGGNDLLSGTTPPRFGADLRSLLASLMVGERRVVMFELPLLPFQNAFGRIQREVCQQYGVTLLPRSFLAGAITLPGHTSDGLHLTAQGHSWLAERVSRLWLDGR